jgi:hypothetical protein
MWIFVVGAFVKLILPADPEESTAFVVASRVGHLLRLLVLIAVTLLFQAAYL